MPVYKDKKRGTWFFKSNSNGEQHIRRGFPTSKIASQKEAEFLLHRNPVVDSTMTFAELKTIFLNWKRSMTKPTYVYETGTAIDNQLMPYFADKRISNITSKDIINWQKSVSEKGYSYNYNQHNFFIFRMMMDFAYKHYGLIENPFSRVDSFRNTKGKKDINFWSKEESDRFIKAITDYDYKVLFFTLLHTGMRGGELQALHINDVDLKKCKIRIKNTYVDKPIKVGHVDSDRLQSPKTTTSKRTITITDEHKEILSKYIEHITKKYKAEPSDFLFGVSKPFSKSQITRMKNFYCKKAKVKQIKLHEFRHTWVSTYVRDFGATDINAIARHIGHSDTRMTWNTYSHMFPNAEEDMIRKGNK